jgi:hypothetical protein
VVSRFPVPFRGPAFGFWVILRPLGSWAFLAVGLPHAGLLRGDHNGVVTFNTDQMRPGGVAAFTPGRRCPPDWHKPTSRRLPLRSGQSFTPLEHPICRGLK